MPQCQAQISDLIEKAYEPHVLYFKIFTEFDPHTSARAI